MSSSLLEAEYPITACIRGKNFHGRARPTWPGALDIDVAWESKRGWGVEQTLSYNAPALARG